MRKAVGAVLTIKEGEIQLFRGDGGLAQLLKQVLNEVLQAEIANHLGADFHERTDGRLGWHSATTSGRSPRGEVPSAAGAPGPRGTFRTALDERAGEGAGRAGGEVDRALAKGSQLPLPNGRRCTSRSAARGRCVPPAPCS